MKSEAEAPSSSDSDADDTPVAEVAAIVEELLGKASVAESLGLDFEDIQRKLPTELKEAVRSGDADWWQGVLHDAKAKPLTKLRG